MVNIIKRGGFREKAARQLKYKNSVNERREIKEQPDYVPEEDRVKKQDELASDEPTDSK
jgi:hypothetical protein